MQVTTFGLIFIPACLVLTTWRRDWLPGLLVVAAVFQAPAVVNVSFSGERHGVSPFSFVALLAALHLAAIVLRSRRLNWGHGKVRSLFWLWAAFLIWSVASAFVLPQVFAGVPLHALSLREGVHVPPVPHQWTISNIAQALNCAVILMLFLYVLQLPNPRKCVRVMMAGFAVALFASSCIGLYQRLAMLGWFPLNAAFWGSNAGYNQYFLTPEYGPAIGRVGLPFIEPSYASVWFAAIAGAALTALALDRDHRRIAAAALLVAALALTNTVGTSGLLAFLGFGFCLTLGLMLTDTRRVAQDARRAATILFAMAGLGCAFLLYQAAYGDAPMFAALRNSAHWTLLKFTDQVTEYRFPAMRQGWQVALDTYGMGAGAGSTRASSYFISLLANTGVIGVGLFLGATARQMLPILSAALNGSRPAIWIGGATGCLVLGIAAGISDQNWPVIWVILLAGFALRREQDAPSEPRP